MILKKLYLILSHYNQIMRVILNLVIKISTKLSELKMKLRQLEAITLRQTIVVNSCFQNIVN